MDTVTANVAPTTATTKNAKSPSSAPAGARRRRRGKPATGADKTENCLFALAVLDAPSDGNLHLQKPVTSEVEILRTAYRSGVNYYRLQKFSPQEKDPESDILQIIGVPAE